MAQGCAYIRPHQDIGVDICFRVLDRRSLARRARKEEARFDSVGHN